jgi:hypothetical protein
MYHILQGVFVQDFPYKQKAQSLPEKEFERDLMAFLLAVRPKSAFAHQIFSNRKS